MRRPDNRLLETRDILLNAINDDSIAEIGERMKRLGRSPEFSKNTLKAIVVTRAPLSRLGVLQGSCGSEFSQGMITATALQRYLLIDTALANLENVASLTVHPTVKRLIYDEFQFYANPPQRDNNLFEVSGQPFSSFCKIALLERFPAGQYHWEISGFPRSWLLKIHKASIMGVVRFIVTKMKGFGPCMEPHMPARSPGSMLILERQSDKSWYRMARSVEMNPAIKGLVAFGWLHSPDTFTVSPHLSFINKPFVESGAFITTMGKAPEDSGFLAGSAERTRLFKSGDFKPTMGVVLWSRKQMIDWAQSHPELDDGE